MPTYEITSPDGKTYEVTAPAGASQEQVMAYVQQQHHGASQQQATAPPAPAAAPEQTFGQKVNNTLNGIGKGFYDVPQSIAELGARGLDAVGLTDNAYGNVHAANRAADQRGAQMGGADMDSNYFKGGRIAGEIATTLPAVALKVPGLAAALPRLAPVINGGLQGASSAALTSEASDAPLGQQLALGGIGGAALPVLAKAAGSVISPAISPAVKALLDRGIPLTPGQIVGGGLKATEDKLSSVPLLGDLIKNGQRNSVIGLNRAAYNDALAPIGVSIPHNVSAGREGVDYVGSQIGKRYDAILPQMNGTLDPQLVQEVTNIASKLKAEGVTDATIDRFKNVVEGQLVQRANSGAYAGDTLKGIQSDLSRLSSHHSSSADSSDRSLGAAIGDVQTAFNDMLLRQNPQFAKPLQEANQAWAQFVRIRKAASSVGSKDGVFSPAQYANAVKASDKSVGKGSYARGKALQQDLSDPANQILPSAVPDSGTPGRLLMALALGGNASINPVAGGAAALGAGLYTKPGQKLAALALAKRPLGAPSLAAGINNYGILGAPALGTLLGSSGY